MDGEKDVWTDHKGNAGESRQRQNMELVSQKSDLKVETEALLCTAQERAIRTNYVKYHSDKSTDDPLCRMCGKREESVQHIINECEKLAQKQYKRRHDNVAKKIHWELCKKN